MTRPTMASLLWALRHFGPRTVVIGGLGPTDSEDEPGMACGYCGAVRCRVARQSQPTKPCPVATIERSGSSRKRGGRSEGA